MLGSQRRQTKGKHVSSKHGLTPLSGKEGESPEFLVALYAPCGAGGPCVWHGSSLLTGERGDRWAAGAAVPPHHLQHCSAGLQEDLGESLPNGLDPQHVCCFLLTLLPMPEQGRGMGGGAGVTVLSTTCPSGPVLYLCLVCILHSISALVMSPGELACVPKNGRLWKP